MIKQTFEKKGPVISFEIFPPKRNGDLASVYGCIDALAELNPGYISVTYGAAGTERNQTTLEVATHIQKNYGIDALAHLTCVAASADAIDRTLYAFKNQGIRHILALRGDLPTGANVSHSADFNYASDLIRHIKAQHDVYVAAACYPQGHIEAKSRTLDLIHLQRKVASGTDLLISQLFFDNAYFYDYLHELRSLDITIPVAAGIMPVLSKRQIERMTELSGATLPDKFKRVLDKYEHNPNALMDAGIAYSCEQIVDLLSSGVDAIHLYVMNKPEVAKRIVNNISGILQDLRR